MQKKVSFIRVVTPLTNCGLSILGYFHIQFICAKLLSPNKPDLYC